MIFEFRLKNELAKPVPSLKKLRFDKIKINFAQSKFKVVKFK